MSSSRPRRLTVDRVQCKSHLPEGALLNYASCRENLLLQLLQPFNLLRVLDGAVEIVNAEEVGDGGDNVAGQFHVVAPDEHLHFRGLLKQWCLYCNT